MNFLEIIVYVATGFVPTLFAMDLAWSFECKRYLSLESNICKIVGTIGNRSIWES